MVERREEKMKRSHRFHQRAIIRCSLALITGGLLVEPTLPLSPAAETLVAATLSQSNSEAADAAQQQTFSGPQPGEKIAPFKVVHVKAAGQQELEIVKDTEDRVTLICFIHRLSNDDRVLFGLGLVDFYAARHRDLTSHFVLLSDDRPKITEMLRRWQQGALFTKSLVSVSVDGAEGPGYYGLNRHVAMTVLVAKGNKVVDNFVFNAPNRNDLHTIMKSVAKALDQPEPELAKVQQELRAERQRQADKRMKASPVFKLAPHAELGRIMFGMVNARGNRSQNAKRRSQQLLDWAGDSEERKAALQKYCKAVLSGDFKLNRYSLAALKKLAEE